MNVLMFLTSIKEDMLFEFQGNFENFEGFNGVYNPQNIRMYFKGYFLQGVVINKETTLFEKCTVNGNVEIKKIKSFDKIILFNKPPKYLTNNYKNQNYDNINK